MNIIPLGTGKCSNFGGPSDTGVGPQEGLSLIEIPDTTEWWFRRIFLNPGLWDSGKNLARNLNPMAFYLAMRFAYSTFGGVKGEILPGYNREQVRRGLFIVQSSHGLIFAQAADWGPNTDTGRLVDLSPGACKAIGVTTDDEVMVSFIPPS